MQKYVQSLKKYCRVADYLAAAQIYLRDNTFLERPLRKEDIKPRLLGHWGTSPGINLVYGATNAAIKEYTDLDFIYVVGPGHGFPAYQSGTFLDRSLEKFYPDKLSFNKAGMEELVYKFSVPFGYPSHINPEAPGAILEGGELGYSLSTAFGAVFDEPGLIAVTLVGDGEAETGPLSAAWQLNRFLNLKRDGAPLPILHLNSYKISGPTIFSSFTDDELIKYFSALSYDPILVDYEKGDLHENILLAMQRAIDSIKMQRSLFIHNEIKKVELPIIILRSPKGMGGIKEFCGEKIEGNSKAHQVVFERGHCDSEMLGALNRWLDSYGVHELLSVNEDGDLILDDEIGALIPDSDRTIGANKYARRGALELKLPESEKYLTKIDKSEHVATDDSMSKVGEYLKDLFELNKNNFRLFSPDETYSNHLQAVFDTTSRVWMWQTHPWEKDLSKDGRVLEILSEHELFGMLQGYTLTGRYGFFVSYEAFAQIVSSMADQYVKFLKQAKSVSWRKDVPSLNIILSSLLERQDHNGFSHQNPSFISDNLDRDLDIIDIYYPADQNIAIHTMQEVLKSRNKLNIMVLGKRINNIFLDKDEASKHCKAGASIWEDYSDDNPDIVLATAGDYVTRESIEAVKIFKQIRPDINLRFVNFNKLDILAEDDLMAIEYLLTSDKPVLFNYHGYPSSIKKLLFGVVKYRRLLINGFMEQGSTTTPFDMLARNQISRFDSVKDLATLLNRYGKIGFAELEEIHKNMNHELKKAHEYALEYGDDPDYLKHCQTCKF